jgi:hypothetical protein
MDTLLLKSLDPGVSTGGADPDPPGIATYSVAGAPAWNQASLDRAPDEAATGAVAEADDLVSSLMKTRGYPASDFDQRASDISVDHPRLVENYRSAHW